MKKDDILAMNVHRHASHWKEADRTAARPAVLAIANGSLSVPTDANNHMFVRNRLLRCIIAQSFQDFWLLLLLFGPKRE